MKRNRTALIFSMLLLIPACMTNGQQSRDDSELDQKVRQFLSGHSRQWYDMNVPAVDGQLLYDIIINRCGVNIIFLRIAPTL